MDYPNRRRFFRCAQCIVRLLLQLSCSDVLYRRIEQFHDNVGLLLFPQPTGAGIPPHLQFKQMIVGLVHTHNGVQISTGQMVSFLTVSVQYALDLLRTLPRRLNPSKFVSVIQSLKKILPYLICKFKIQIVPLERDYPGQVEILNQLFAMVDSLDELSCAFLNEDVFSENLDQALGVLCQYLTDMHRNLMDIMQHLLVHGLF